MIAMAEKPDYRKTYVFCKGKNQYRHFGVCIKCARHAKCKDYQAFKEANA